MKTKLLVLSFGLFFSMAAMAQLNFGFKAGANLTKVAGKSFKEEFRYGYHLGAFAELGLGGPLSVQPELIFNQYQTKVSSQFSDIYNNAASDALNKNVKLNYLSIPIVANYKLANLISLQAGPQFSILMNKEKDLFQNGKDAFNKGDFSLLGGAQVKLGNLRFTGRYIVGLTNINDIDNRDKWRNQAIQLSIGYAL